MADLADADPAAYGRLAFLPARPLTGRSGVHAQIDALLPAFARLLLDQHALYVAEGLLPLPESMAAHAAALLRSSRLCRFQPAYVRFARAWVARGREQASEFISECMPEVLMMARAYQKQGWVEEPGEIASMLIDACLAEAGH